MSRTRKQQRTALGSRMWLMLGIGFLLGMFGIMPKPDIQFGVRWSVPVLGRESYVPAARSDSGSELVFVFIGSSRCHWSNRPELRSLVGTAILAVRDRSRAQGDGFAAIGIARDVVASEGVAHLAAFGEFDEVMAGRGWLNAGVLHYIYNELPGPAATPQIVVLRRTVVVDNGQRSVTDERVVARKAGVAEIRGWVEDGLPVDPGGAVRP